MGKRKEKECSVSYWKSKDGAYIVPASEDITKQYTELHDQGAAMVRFLKDCTPVSILIELSQLEPFEHIENYCVSDAKQPKMVFTCEIDQKKFYYDGINIIHRYTIVCDECFLKGILTPQKGCKDHFKGVVCNHKNKFQENCDYCFLKSFASFWKDAVESWSQQNISQPWQFSKNSHVRCIFNCKKCPHEFDIDLHHIMSGQWCPFCSNKRLCELTECDICFAKSFASHPKSIFWSKKNPENPRQLFKNSSAYILFDCDCGHEFTSILSHINNGSWCKFCCNPPQALCDSQDCTKCFDKSFASHPKAQFWSAKNELKPRQVFKNSNRSFLFDCNCGHEINCKLGSVNFGQWCKFCSNPPKELCKSENCVTCFEKSFASNPKSKFWSIKNPLQPRQLFKNSNLSYFLDCDKCSHEIFMALNRISKGNWCKFCFGQVCGKEACKICDRVCDICKFRKGQRFTKITKRFCCETCFKDCIQRDPNETPLQLRRKITLEILCLAEFIKISFELDLYNWSEPTSWDCAILPNLGFKPDIIFCFDVNGNIFTTAGACKLDTNEIDYTLIVEIIEESRKTHSAERNPSDEIREMEIRPVFKNKIGFLYFTVAHKNHLSAHKSDVYFDRNETEYFVMEDRKTEWQKQITNVLTILQNMLERKSQETIFIGY
jgi:hypothetical protein